MRSNEHAKNLKIKESIMKLGFETLQDQAPAFDPVSIADALQAGLEGFGLIEEFDDEVASLMGMMTGLENLEMVQAAVEAHGAEASLVAMVGKEVGVIAPSILADEIDVEALKGELSVAQEGFAKKVVDAIKAMIDKIVTFVKNFFDKAGKVQAANATLVAAIKVSDVDADKLKATKLKGLDAAAFKTSVAGLSGSPAALKKIADLYKKGDMTVEALQTEADKILAEMGSVMPATGKDTIGGLGFTAASIIAHAADCRKLIDTGKTLPAIVDAQKAAIAKQMEGPDVKARAVAMAFVAGLNAITSMLTKEILKRNIQELSMLKACQKASGKVAPAKEGLSEEEIAAAAVEAERVANLTDEERAAEVAATEAAAEAAAAVVEEDRLGREAALIEIGRVSLLSEDEVAAEVVAEEAKKKAMSKDDLEKYEAEEKKKQKYKDDMKKKKDA
jgi:hypothetical protein